MWPGIICPDPVDGQYVTYGLDGAVESHHVEFLGEPHSRTWTNIRNIDPYPGSFKAGMYKRKKDWCEWALEKASQLLARSAHQRLEMCYLSRNVLSETEVILKDLDQILKHVSDSSKPSFKSFADGEDNNLREKVTNCCTEFIEKRPMEINTQEDCIIIDGKALKAEECIESITDRFKEIDSLMAEFQDSL